MDVDSQENDVSAVVLSTSDSQPTPSKDSPNASDILTRCHHERIVI